MTFASPFAAGYAQRPSALRLARFSSLAAPVAAAGTPLVVFLPAIFAGDFGLPLGVVGLIFLLERLWGTATDPLVGALSDHTRSRLGRRKPWIAGGGAILALSGAALFFPPERIGPVWLAASLFFFYFGWAALQIPFLAWSGEISADYHERTRIATYQTVASALGLLAMQLFPTIADQIRPGDGRLHLALMGSLLLATLVPGVLLSLTAFPEVPTEERPARFSVGNSFRAVFRNPLILRVLASDFAVTAGQSIRAALFIFYVTIYMGKPAWGAGLFLFQFVFGILAGPIWGAIGWRFGKHRTAIAGELVQAAINFGLLAVTPDRFGLLLALTLAQGLTQGSGNLMLRAIVADVADKQKLETGEQRAGLYFSVFSLSAKAGMAAAIGIALPLVAWLGFAPRGPNSPEALHGLALVFALGPALAHLLSAALITGFPLDEAAYHEIRRQLDTAHALQPAE